MAAPRTKVSTTLESTIGALQLQPEDSAAVQLARRYAAVLDEYAGAPEVLKEIGPKFLAVLVELGATPGARGKAAKGGTGDGGSTVRASMDELRARRATRSN